MRIIFFTLMSFIGLIGLSKPAVADSYHVTKTTLVPGEGGWDFLAVDDANRNVYISHSTKVDVLDADSGELKGTRLKRAGYLKVYLI